MLVRRRHMRCESTADVHREGKPDEYAAEADERLRRVAAMHMQIRHLIGRVLSMLRDQNGFSKLGYPNMAKYAEQVLGMTPRVAQELAFIETELRSRPNLRDAYLTRSISYSALLHVLRKTPTCTEEMWAEMLERRTLIETQDLVVEFWRLYEEALLARRAARAASGEGEAEKPDKRQKVAKKRKKRTKLDPRVRQAAERYADNPDDKGGDASFRQADEEEQEGRWIDFLATPSLAARYFVGVELARRLAGEELPVSQCLEMWGGEMMSGPGVEALQTLMRSHAAQAGEPENKQSEDIPCKPTPDPIRRQINEQRAWERAFWAEVERDIHEVNQHWRDLDWRKPAVEPLRPDLEPSEQMTVFELHGRLRRIMRIEHRVDCHFRRLLLDFSQARHYLHLEFVSLGHYAQERLLMSRTTAKDMIWLEKQLRKFDLVRKALEAGRLNRSQAAAVCHVATPASEALWIEHARNTTVRFLKDDIAEARQMEVFDPQTFARTFGIPQGGRRRTSMSDDGVDDLSGEGRTSVPGAGDGTPDDLSDEGGTSAPGAGSGTPDDLSDEGRTFAPGAGGGTPEDLSGEGRTSAPGAGDGTPDDPSDEGRTSAPGERPKVAPLPLPTFRDRLQMVLDDVNGEYDDDPFQGVSVRLRFFLPAEMEEFLDDLTATANIVLGGYGGFQQTLELCLDSFLCQYGEEALRELRKHPILARDGWRCAVPNCGRRGVLHVHHIIFRSRGGGNHPSILITLCEAHHLQGVHQGRIRIRGRAPDGLIWELGIRPDGTCVMLVHGRTIVSPLEHPQAKAA